VEIAKQTASDRGFSSRPGAEPARQRLIAVRPAPQDTLMLRFASDERVVRAFHDDLAVDSLPLSALWGRLDVGVRHATRLTGPEAAPPTFVHCTYTLSVLWRYYCGAGFRDRTEDLLITNHVYSASLQVLGRPYRATKIMNLLHLYPCCRHGQSGIVPTPRSLIGHWRLVVTFDGETYGRGAEPVHQTLARSDRRARATFLSVGRASQGAWRPH
jgi:hypothetical protein